MPLNIDSAYYSKYMNSGGTNVLVYAFDVTEKVKTFPANGGTVNFTVNASTFGVQNPAGVTGSFTVNYSYGNLPDRLMLTKSGVDNSLISLSDVPNQTYVRKATYGNANKILDITGEINAWILSTTTEMIFTVGSGDFLDLFCGGSDVDEFDIKTLTLTLGDSKSGPFNPITTIDGQIVNLSTIGPTP